MTDWYAIDLVDGQTMDVIATAVPDDEFDPLNSWFLPVDESRVQDARLRIVDESGQLLRVGVPGDNSLHSRPFRDRTNDGERRTFR